MEEHERAGALDVDACGCEGGIDGVGFGAGVEDDAGRFEVDQLVITILR